MLLLKSRFSFVNGRLIIPDSHLISTQIKLLPRTRISPFLAAILVSDSILSSLKLRQGLQQPQLPFQSGHIQQPPSMRLSPLDKVQHDAKTNRYGNLISFLEVFAMKYPAEEFLQKSFNPVDSGASILCTSTTQIYSSSNSSNRGKSGSF